MGNSLSRRNHGNRGQQAQPAPAAQNAYPYAQQHPSYGPRPTSNGRFYGNLPTQYPEQYPGYRQGAGHRQAAAAARQPTQLQQTKTIRNQVNLKKSTLRLVPRPGDGNVLTPTFKFDASAPCSVTVFFMAEESDKRCMLMTQKQEAGARVMYEKGLGHMFPPADDDECAETHSLDVRLYKTADLTNMALTKSDAFPIVIRLETVTDKGAQEGHDLAELDPGCATPTWVQSQTTYACLVKEEDGTWEARPIRQKIWVENVPYELQEIYGIQDIYGGDKKEKGMALGTVGSQYSEDLEGRECVICLAAVRDTTVLPCRHMCMCEACARELQRQQVSRCPICRDVIESLLHIKRPEKKAGDKKEDPAADKLSESVSAK